MAELHVRLLLAGALFLGAFPVPGAETTIVLKEHLNRQWNGELLTYPLEFPEGQCVPDSVVLSGPNGQIPSQLSAVQLWPDTEFVKSAGLSFIVDELRPLTALTYKVTYGPEAVKQETPNTDLKLTSKDGQLEITTSRFGVRLPLGGKTFSRPASPADVSGPLLGLRMPNKTWLGSSMLYGDTDVKSWSSKITDQGPAFVRLELAYTFTDGNELKVGTQVSAGDNAVLVDMDVGQSRPDDGWGLFPTQPANPEELITLIGQRHYAKEVKKKLDPGSGGPLCFVNPWPGDTWFPENPAAIRLPLKDYKGEVQIAVRRPGDWATPQARPYWADFTKWTYEMIPQMWSGWQSKRIPVTATNDGPALWLSLLKGQRKLAISVTNEGQKLLARFHAKEMSVHGPMPRLNEVKDLVLEWPDGEDRHPYLFMDAAEMEAGGKRSPQALKELRNVDRLRAVLDKLGTIDLMRQVMAAACQYDAIIDSGLITPEDRKLFRAQATYLAYVTADPFHWSLERGYCSGNPNMTVTRVVDLGLMGCALRDHPMGRQWAEYAIDWMKYWLAEVTDDTGGWPESSHYARVSWSDFIQLAIAARQAGLHDFFTDPKFKAMALFYEKTPTPPDPLRRAASAHPDSTVRPGVRACPPYGRGTRGGTWGLGGLLARATAETDPEFSKVMQWSWRECGFVDHFSHSTAGASSLYVNRELPLKPPDWGSEFLPSVGYLLRSHVATPKENYLLFVSRYYQCADGQIWPPHTGIIAKWFANGCPIGGGFRRIPKTSHVLLENRVLLACNWDPKVGESPETGYFTQTGHHAFASLPQLDYVNVGFVVPEYRPIHLDMPGDAPTFPKRDRIGEPPFHWRRQLLLSREQEPGGVNYLVLRDTVQGEQPTQWHFWTLSEKIGSPEEVKDRAAFLKDKPGDKITASRELKGNRFTALGQFELDLDYYIASPVDTPRYTLRYGTTGSAYAIRGFNEFQDLLHLQLPDDGSYFVAMFPRPQAEAPPTFETLGKGAIIKIAGAFGRDYCFLASEPREAKADKAAFSGTCGSVRDRKQGLSLHLGAAGSVGYGDYELASPVACSLSVAADSLKLHFPDNSPGGELTVTAPGKLSLPAAPPGVTLSTKGKRHILAVPPKLRSIKLLRK